MRMHHLAAALAGAALHVTTVSSDGFDARAARLDAGLVVAAVHVNGNGPHRFVVDTGATTSALDRDFAAGLGLVSSGQLRIVTSAGSFAGQTSVVKDLRIGDLHAGAVRMSIMPLDALRTSTAAIVGVIGQDVLSRTTLVVDYGRGRVRIADIACEPGDASLAMSLADGRPMIAAHVEAVGDPGTRRLVIDSAANGLILFTNASSPRAAATVSTHAGTTAAAVIKNAYVQVADLAFRQPAYVVRPPEARIEDGLLPASWFSRICLDGRRNLAVLTR